MDCHDQSASGATLFVEPLVTVRLNNEWLEQQLKERDGVRRILVELSDLVGAQAEVIRAIVLTLAKFDLTLMMAYAEDLHASQPLLVAFNERDNGHPGSVIRLREARHPLLDAGTVVPIDVVLDDDTFGVVITGPNTGEKRLV